VYYTRYNHRRNRGSERRKNRFRPATVSATDCDNVLARPVIGSTSCRSLPFISCAQLNSTANYGRRCLTPLSPHHPYILYDTRCYFNVRSKADMSQLNLYRTETTTKNCKTEKPKSKNRYARSNSKSLGNRVVSPAEEKERLQWEALASTPPGIPGTPPIF